MYLSSLIRVGIAISGNADSASTVSDDCDGSGGEVDVSARCDVLRRNITLCIFNYIRRGLFEVDKLTVATLLALKILVNDGKMEASEVEYLINGGTCVDPGNMGPLHEWMPENIWRKVKALESMPRFRGIGDSMQSDSDDWGAWFDVEKGKFGLLRCLLSLAPSIILTHLARSLRAHDTQWKK